MDTVLNIAAWFADKYRQVYCQEIDEMKMHKLLYLAQRESLARTNRPLFGEQIYAWQFGPVVQEIRQAFKNGTLPNAHWHPEAVDNDAQSVLEFVFEAYSGKDAWSLSRLSHAEYSWQKARNHKKSGGGFRLMPIEDIQIDAQRIARRRQLLHELGLR